jgi:hypothetical protein
MVWGDASRRSEGPEQSSRTMQCKPLPSICSGSVPQPIPCALLPQVPAGSCVGEDILRAL